MTYWAKSTEYVLLEPDLFTFLVISVLVCLTAARFRHAAHPFLMAAGVFTALRVAFELTITAGFNPDFQQYYVYTSHASQSLRALLWLLLALPLATLPRRWIHRIGALIFYLAMAMTILFLLRPVRGVLGKFAGDGTLGLIFTPSLNASLLAMTLPFLKGHRWAAVAGFIFTAWAVACSHHLMPLIIFGIVATAWLIKKDWTWYFPMQSIAIVVLWHWAPMKVHGRWPDYLFFLEQFHAHWSGLWGFGVNKFLVWGPILQIVNDHSKEIWLHAHSDFLQLYLEQGLIGLLLWGSVAGLVVCKAYRTDIVLFQVSLGLVVLMTGYFPLSTSSGAIVAILCLSVLRTTDKRHDSANRDARLKCRVEQPRLDSASTTGRIGR